MNTPVVPSVLSRTAVGKTIAAIVISLFIIAVVCFVLRNFLPFSPPTLESSTPRTQGNFTLVDIERTQRDGLVHLRLGAGGGPGDDITFAPSGEGVLLVKVKGDPPVSTNQRLDYDPWRDYTCVAKPSGGPPIAFNSLIPSEIEYPGLFANGKCLLPDDVMAFNLHLSGPASWRYLDIVFSKKHGASARWRFSNLPHIQYISLHPKVSDEHVVIDGLTINTFSSRSFKDGDWGMINTDFTALKDPRSHYIYSISVKRRSYNVLCPPTAAGLSAKAVEWEEWSQSVLQSSFIQSTFVPFADSYTAFTFNGVVKKLELLEEPVTFENVLVPQESRYVPNDVLTETTPSGIDVTYMPGGGSSDYPTQLRFNEAFQWYPIEVSSNALYSLPKSPLYKKYSRPVMIAMYSKDLNYCSLQDYALKQYRRHNPNVLVHHDSYYGDYFIVKKLNVTVGQIVEVEDTSFSITVPVHPWSGNKYIKVSKNHLYYCYTED